MTCLIIVTKKSHYISFNYQNSDKTFFFTKIPLKHCFVLQSQYLLEIIKTHKIPFNDHLISKISVEDHLTCKKQSLNNIFEIKQSLNEKYCLIFV
jgi:hypothetical protein